MTQPANILGIHDNPGDGNLGRLFGASPGWVLHTVALKNEQATNGYVGLSEAGYGNIVRLNWGYGSDGTIPLGRANEFAAMCAAYVRHSPGIDVVQIANEPNHQNERPGGQIITPETYVRHFAMCYDAIKRVDARIRVIPAAVAPYHADPMVWIDYLSQMLEEIDELSGCDGINIHAYTRGWNAGAIYSDAEMGGILGNTFSGFRTYEDALSCVPSSMRGLPAYITEFNPVEGWPSHNSGIIQAAARKVSNGNAHPAAQKIHALICFRWRAYPPNPAWGIKDKPGTQEDFRQAVAQGYAPPAVTAAGSARHTAHLPTITVGAPPQEPPQPQEPKPMREWDERLTQRGVRFIRAPMDVPEHGTRQVWRLVKAEFYNVDEARRLGPDHHVLVDVLDSDGKRAGGVPVRFYWADGQDTKPTESKPGQSYAVDFPMYAAGNSYSVYVDGGFPSDIVSGMGMGDIATPRQGDHVSYRLVFKAQEVSGPFSKTPQKSDEKITVEGGRTSVPPLTHPVADPQYRTITQVFGVNGDYYKQFAVDGVPLRGHNGVDFGTPVGVPIVAVADGQVVEVADDPGGYGQYVKLAHAWGESLYAHLDVQRVHVGETAWPGQYIGLSGNTGNSTGPHLHFGMRISPFNRRDGMGGYSDPLPYLQQSRATPSVPGDIIGIVRAAAREFGVDEHLFLSQILSESSFDPTKVSSAGARGLGQIMPNTWAEWAPIVGATDIFNPVDNARVAAAYHAWCRKQVDRDWRALVAYGWGIGNLTLSGKPIPHEWQAYANEIEHGKWLLDAVRG